MTGACYFRSFGGHRMPGRFPDARFPRLVNASLGP